MGKPNPGANDLAMQVLTGPDLTAPDAATPWFEPAAQPPPGGPTGFNLAVWGAFVARAVLEKSYDGGTTAIPCTRGEFGGMSFAAPLTVWLYEMEKGCLYRLRLSAHQSGNVSWRFSR